MKNQTQLPTSTSLSRCGHSPSPIWVMVVFFLSAAHALAQYDPDITINLAEECNDTIKAFPTLSRILPDSPEGKNIVAAAALIADFGFDEEATNVLTWLDAGKIFHDDLPPGEYGNENPSTTNITINESVLIPPTPEPNPLDPSDPYEFYLLFQLAGSLYHEKVHAHQPPDYIINSTFTSIFNSDPAEQDAWTEELAFLDSVIDTLTTRISDQQEAPLEELEPLFEKLKLALNSKIWFINSYYDEHPHYGPIPYTLEDAAELQRIKNDELSELLDLIDELGFIDWSIFSQIQSDLDSFGARVNPLVQEWLDGEAQRWADAEGEIAFFCTVNAISGGVFHSCEYHPGDWISNRKLVSDLSLVQGDPVQFDPPAVLVMPFNPSVIGDITNINIYSYDPASGSWEKLTACRLLDSEAHTISVNINGFSVQGSVVGVFEDSSSGTVNLNPTNIVWQVTGPQLILSWPADHIGWRLQAQTNSLSTGLGTNWVDVSGSITTNQVIITINPANGAVFYRMAY